MKFSRFLICALAMAVLCLGGKARAAEEPAAISFGIISTESSITLKQLWEPFIEAMSKRTGVPVKAYFASDYAGIIEAMRFGKVDVAWTGNKGAMGMVDRSGGEFFAQAISAGGESGYYSLLIVNKDSSLKTLDDVLSHAKDLTFSNGDPNSTSGNLVPGYYIFAKRDLDPRKIFKRTLNGSHEANAMAVANGKADVATFNSSSMKRLTGTHPDVAEKLRVVWTSPVIPDNPMVWRKALPDDLRAKIKAFVLDYGTKGPDAAAERAQLQKINREGFRASDDSQLIPLRKIECYRQIVKIQDSQTMSDEEKKAKIAELNAQMKKYGD